MGYSSVFEPASSFVGADLSKWDTYFGNFAATHPIIVSEWHENTGPLGGLSYDWCNASPLDTVQKAFAYFQHKGFDGIVAWAYDADGWVVTKGYSAGV